MELNEKIRELRSKRSMTQSELAEMLYVSRAAVSKWESGRGYPNIDSLRKIAEIFSVSVDELLSSSELLTVAEVQTRRGRDRLCDLVFGLLDIAAVLLWILPLFRLSQSGTVTAVSLLALDGAYRISCCIAFSILPILGLLILAFRSAALGRVARPLSLSLSALSVILLIVGLHPYAAVLLLVFLAVKAAMLIGCR